MITLVTTLGDLPPDRQGPVMAAMKQNASHPEVDSIVVVTEGLVDWLLNRDDLDVGKISVISVSARPTFADMISAANNILATGANAVAILNADISFASGRDIARTVEALEVLTDSERPVVLALARHETGANGEPSLTLYEPSGTPNTISADMWAFARKLTVPRDLFYCLGQMNCDMLFAHDLTTTGHDVYNPCLSITILHNETEKGEDFYSEQNAKLGTQRLLERHSQINAVDPWNYFGAPWVRSDWLALGYKPRVNSTHGKRIIVALTIEAEGRLKVVLPELAEMAELHDLEIQIVCDGDIDRLVRSNIATLARAPRIWLARPRATVAATARALLNGSQYSFKCLAFIQEPARISAELLAVADGIFVQLQENPTPVVEPEFGCSLVTSVFRSDRFLRGFLRNSKALIGYGREIEHIFLVSGLSEFEVELFADLIRMQPNVVIVWHQNDPGLYACWNIGIRVARTEFVSNANVDDLRDPRHVVALVRELATHPEAVVAASALVPFYEYPADGTPPPPEPVWYADQAGDFRFQDLARPVDPADPRLEPHNIPHCMPVWRRSLHDRYGWFDEPKYGTYADWAFWLNALEGGGIGRLLPDPLSYYFVNPTSHNRRGADLVSRHRVIEEEFLPRFLARAQGRRAEVALVEPVRKLHLYGRELDFGRHRNDFSRLIQALEPLDRGPGGVRFVPFLERQFVWGDSSYAGEAASKGPRPIIEPWIGILHVPFESPVWFERNTSPEVFFETELFRASLPSCRGLITLSADLERDLKHHLPGLPTLSVLHPTEFDSAPFDLSAYRASPTVVQIGDWLRKLQAIHRLKASGHRRVMLLKRWTSAFLDREIEKIGGERDPSVEMLEFVPNDEYDRYLTSSVVLCLLYGAAANNVVLECIARATPILINPLPAVVEYLGAGYPLYAVNEAEADALLAIPGRVEGAHAWLLRRRAELDLSYQGFCREIAASRLYSIL